MNRLTSELLLDPAANLNGSQVTIDGILLISEELAVVELLDGAIKLPIRDTTLTGRLLDNVPCYIRGDYLYRDSVSFVGVIRQVGGEMEILSTVLPAMFTLPALVSTALAVCV